MRYHPDYKTEAAAQDVADWVVFGIIVVAGADNIRRLCHCTGRN